MGEVQVPEARTYTYESAGKSWDIKIDRVSSGPDRDEVTVRHDRTIDHEVWDGTGRTLVRRLLERSTPPDPNEPAPRQYAECQWAPPLTLLRRPLEVGAAWTSESECRPPNGEGGVVVHRRFEATVVGTATERVGRETHAVAILRVHEVVIETLVHGQAAEEDDEGANRPPPGIEAWSERKYEDRISLSAGVSVLARGTVKLSRTATPRDYETRLVRIR